MHLHFDLLSHNVKSAKTKERKRNCSKLTKIFALHSSHIFLFVLHRVYSCMLSLPCCRWSLEAIFNGIRSFAYALNMRVSASAICIKCVYYFNGYCIIYWSFRFSSVLCSIYIPWSALEQRRDKVAEKKKRFQLADVPVFSSLSLYLSLFLLLVDFSVGFSFYFALVCFPPPLSEKFVCNHSKCVPHLNQFLVAPSSSAHQCAACREQKQIHSGTKITNGMEIV